MDKKALIILLLSVIISDVASRDPDYLAQNRWSPKAMRKGYSKLNMNQKTGKSPFSFVPSLRDNQPL